MFERPSRESNGIYFYVILALPTEHGRLIAAPTERGETDRRGRRASAKGHSPLNMNVFRKTALSLATQAQYGRVSKSELMFKLALNPEVFLNILFARNEHALLRR